ncbi:protein sof1-like isoform X2 [Salvia miltiorrhiza]|nr:protein sof1-like isoform X2 [Salvia miltiorrhiza]XP_057783489.1 protein sof1-like isoform X2 [Salvia miltiorrhiza]XP_057783490.1 protein sof1-like isoform X2 [Salvia miltiorrhiza]
MNEARCVHRDHVSAVMDIDYSPTGREFGTGSYDRTGLLCEVQEGQSVRATGEKEIGERTLRHYIEWWFGSKGKKEKVKA